MSKKIIITILSILLFISLICNNVLYYRLDKNRQQLESVRVQLDRSHDNYRAITERLGRTGEILSESATTVRDIRNQISEIRKVFEDLENYINSVDSSSDMRGTDAISNK